MDQDNLQATTLSLPILKKRSILAFWTLILNLSYYGSPILAAIGGITYLGLSTVGGAGDSLVTIGGLVLIAVYFSILVIALGIAMVILDIIYLLKMKPVGLKKALIVTSLCLYLVSLYIFYSMHLLFSLTP